MKVAIVHDWLTNDGGAEKCLQSFISIFPDADIFSLVDFLDEPLRDKILSGKRAKSSFIQKMPFAKKYFRFYLPLFPLAIEQFDLREYDIVISSSHAVAKGVLTHHDQQHFCYCYTPMRYAWDMYFNYLQDHNYQKGIRSFFLRVFLHKIRAWDIISTNRVDHFIAISDYVKKRIQKIYGRDSSIIHPPVDIDKFPLCTEKDDYYITLSRLVPYKKIDMIVEAFVQNKRRLIVIGDGPLRQKIEQMATGNISVLGYLEEKEAIDYMKKAKAFIFAAEEDFGITPIEAQACGTPVICFNQGGTRETVIDQKTGIFFNGQTTTSLNKAITIFEKEYHKFQPDIIRQHSEKFSKQRFEKEVINFINEKIR